MPWVASQRERERLRCRGAGLGKPVKSRLDEVINGGDVEGDRFCGEPPKGVFRNGEVGHGVLHRSKVTLVMLPRPGELSIWTSRGGPADHPVAGSLSPCGSGRSFCVSTEGLPRCRQGRSEEETAPARADALLWTFGPVSILAQFGPGCDDASSPLQVRLSGPAPEPKLNARRSEKTRASTCPAS